MTTPTPIPDFCVSSNAGGFNEFLRVFNEHLRDIVGFADNKRTGYYYGYENGSPISIQEAWIPLILTHQAIALLTAKPLTEGLVRGNNFECIESFLSFRDEVMYKKGKEYKCDVDGMLRNEHGTLDNLDKTLLNRHFKLLPTTQEDFKIPVTESEVEQFEKDFPIDVYLSESKSEEMRKNILNSTQEESVKRNDETKSKEGDLIVGNMFECIEAVRLQGGEGHGKIIYIKGEVYECEYEGCITDHLYERHRFWNLSNEMLNRHFKLIEPAQEEKVNAKIDSLTSQLVQSSLEDELKMSDNPKLKNFGEHISTQEEIVKRNDETKSKEDILIEFGCPVIPFDENVTMYYPAILSAMQEYSNQQTATLQQQLKEANLLLLNIKNTIELNNIQKVFPETYPQINQFLTRNK